VRQHRAEHLGRNLSRLRRHRFRHGAQVVADERRVTGGLDGGGAGLLDRGGEGTVGGGRGPGTC
jgi:hypothetical protein